jgi:hypothetical protein
LNILKLNQRRESVDAEKAKKTGIRGICMKPVILKDLAEMVRRVLDE